MAKSKWNDVKEKLTLVEAWARDGLLDKDIAAKLHISLDSFYKYKKEHNEFSDALKNGKESIDVEVENALLKRALGYSYVEVTEEPIYLPDGKQLLDEEGKPLIAVTKRVTKQVSPDTTAQIFWLKNRKRAEWRDRQEIEMNAEVTYEVKPNSLLTPEE